MNDYLEADPFPHRVIDNYITPDFAATVAAEFPDDPAAWGRFHNEREKKAGCADPARFGPATHLLAQHLISTETVRWLGDLTGITDLKADLTGGGYHQIGPGGHLDVHVDFNRTAGWYRRINFLIYLNPFWVDDWEGHLLLCRPDGEVVQRIAPIAGRAVIFSTSERSYHGHPAPLACPEGTFRRSFAVYYYSPEPPPDAAGDHSTLWLGA